MTDMQRREKRVQKAEARLPASMDDVVDQMNGGLAVQQAAHNLDADDKWNTDYLELASKGLSMLRSQASAPTSRGAKRLRQDEDEG